MKRFLRFFAVVIATGATSSLAAQTNQLIETTPTPYLSPSEEAKTFVLPKGYRLELVVSDPVIREPVTMAFDGNGRMFIAEMRTYMQDIDGKDEHTPHGKISLHWSSKRDGNYDQHTTFIDNLILPRMILWVGNGLLVNETDTYDLWLYRDTDGDGVAEKKERVFAEGARGGNLEHQQSGLMWALDNWIYMTVNSYRLRMAGTTFIKEPTPPNGGQWGIAQDNYGKPWFLNAGGEIGPLNFQQPIIYGAFSANGQFAPGFTEVWPLVGMADVQGGTIRFRPEDKTLNHFTATCGGEIFRGDRLPQDLRGDLVFAEPVGRLIRRAKVEQEDGITRLRNAYDKTEFILSTDPNFRPVNLFNAPDGTLYIVDMYRGIIQEGNWVKEGSYLRNVVQQFELEKNFGRGRIWRLVHDDFKPGSLPRMQDERSGQLVKHLAHANGWWRDTAQKLLVRRNDKSVVSALEKMARNESSHLGRIHALWTLEGLDAVHATLLHDAFHDAHPQVRIAAIRISETLYKKGLSSVVPYILSLATDSDPNVVIQVMMTANLLKLPQTANLLTGLIAETSSAGVKEIGAQMVTPSLPKNSDFTAAEKKLLKQGEIIYKELCFACHGTDGKGMPVQGSKDRLLAPPLAGSKTVSGASEGVIAILLKGLTGPVDGKTYDSLMVSMQSNNDEWIASVASFVRNGFGNFASLVEAGDVARVRADTIEHDQPWTLEELITGLPQQLTDRKNWKLTASHNSALAARVLDGDVNTRYDTGATQISNMWFQIELPQETTVAGMQLLHGDSFRDYPRGYRLELSSDGTNWGAPVISKKGSTAETEIFFTPAKTKFLRITQTETTKEFWWSIHELQLFAPATKQLRELKSAPMRKEANPFE